MLNNQKTALITGATSGIGLELAKLFAQDNYNLVIVARNQNDLNDTANELKIKNGSITITPISKDLFNPGDAFALCDEIKAKGIIIDVLVNDAGQGVYGEFKDTDIERELGIINLNISSLVILTKHFVKEMAGRGEGKILNLASIASKLPGPWQSVYHGTKAFVLSFSEAIREELKDSGVTVTALLPGPTDTDFFNKAGMQNSKILQDKEALSNPAEVAKDGYDALMAGDDKIISGFKNKVQVNISNVTPDSSVAHMLYEQQKPVEQELRNNDEDK
ncbi:SDR family NAD(P)-dependent oxidoreductase [Mucilaginibacter pocheonensis]|uniref:Short-subunit dehydrogenase n=1 Tax=Mucilaginibacter pocheonensis TaxID=398050 RepID=A0ABU1TCM6_9SPHI|nr:SDR family oxidoreductase [Mucilaginibacter pocheonensis]MDR6943152.1 short-subunit dehydrogenase [Mucilaginibacter pocheonensis]